MDEQTRDPLDDLIVEETEKPDLSLLAELLKNYIRLAKSGEILFEEDFHKDKEWKKVLRYLLARKAGEIKNLIDEERITADELANKTYIPHQNVINYINRELKQIIRKDNKGYFVPNFNLMRCKSLLGSTTE